MSVFDMVGHLCGGLFYGDVLPATHVVLFIWPIAGAIRQVFRIRTSRLQTARWQVVLAPSPSPGLYPDSLRRSVRLPNG